MGDFHFSLYAIWTKFHLIRKFAIFEYEQAFDL